MSLLAWYLAIPGHEQNVRVPAVLFHLPKATQEEPSASLPIDYPFEWGSSKGSTWNFDMSFEVNQGIPIDAALGIPSKRDRSIAPGDLIVSRGSNLAPVGVPFWLRYAITHNVNPQDVGYAFVNLLQFSNQASDALEPFVPIAIGMVQKGKFPRWRLTVDTTGS